MNIDVETVKQTFSTIGMIISTLKQAKDLLPEGEKKNNITENIEQAERQLQIAESQSAQGMGYELCRNHFPPEIMLSADNSNWECPKCGNKINPRPKKQNPWSSLGNT